MWTRAPVHHHPWCVFFPGRYVTDHSRFSPSWSPELEEQERSFTDYDDFLAFFNTTVAPLRAGSFIQNALVGMKAITAACLSITTRATPPSLLCGWSLGAVSEFSRVACPPLPMSPQPTLHHRT